MPEEVQKNFSSSKNLTECDGARQQYDYENKDKVGSSTPPIDLEKGPISTMSPKVVGSETQDPIIGGGQLDYMKKAENSDGVMIAIKVPENIAEQLVIEDGLPIEEMHITLFYFGDTYEIDSDTKNKIIKILNDNPINPIKIELTRTYIFEGGEEIPLVALVKSPELMDYRSKFADILDNNNIFYSKDHIYIPHITLKYLTNTIDTKEINISFKIDSVNFYYGNKIEKDYAPVTGVYSTQHQIPGEMSNLITEPIAVDAAVETKRKNILNQNKEPYFEKMDPNLEDEDFFKAIDEIIFDEEVMEINKSYSMASDYKLPLGAEDLAKKLELSLNSSLRKSINSWFFDIAKSTETEDALVSLKKSLIVWHKDISKGTLPGFNALVDFGIKAGVRKSRVPISKQSYDIIKDLSMSEKGVALSLHNFSDLAYSKISKCAKDIPMGSYKQKRAIDSELKSLKPKTKSLLKSEVAKFGNFGMESALKKFKEAV